MSSAALPKKQSKDSFLQLLFLIDPATKDIKFSNHPLGPETAIAATGIPAFIELEKGSEQAQVMAEWEKCLRLQPGESRYFGCRVKTKTGELVPVVFKALGIEMSGDPPTYILFHAEQTGTDAAEWKSRFEQLNTRFEEYKKEYSDFIDIAAHDLDAPLRKLSTFMDRLSIKLKAGSAYEEIEEYFPRIDASLKEMRSLIDGLSVLSRVNLKKSEYSNCNIEEIVQEILSGMQLQVNEKKATITTSALPVIKGDRNQLIQLFKSLVENAIKFSKEGVAPEITIQSVEINGAEKKYLNPDAGQFYKIQVADNGIGFKQEFAERIFLPFQRLHGKSQFPGNGIGLAVCKKIIDNHQGIMYAEGDENSGACFTLILPQTPH